MSKDIFLIVPFSIYRLLDLDHYFCRYQNRHIIISDGRKSTFERYTDHLDSLPGRSQKLDILNNHQKNKRRVKKESQISGVEEQAIIKRYAFLSFDTIFNDLYNISMHDFFFQIHITRRRALKLSIRKSLKE